MGVEGTQKRERITSSQLDFHWSHLGLFYCPIRHVQTRCYICLTHLFLSGALSVSLFQCSSYFLAAFPSPRQHLLFFFPNHRSLPGLGKSDHPGEINLGHWGRGSLHVCVIQLQENAKRKSPNELNPNPTRDVSGTV